MAQARVQQLRAGLFGNGRQRHPMPAACMVAIGHGRRILFVCARHGGNVLGRSLLRLFNGQAQVSQIVKHCKMRQITTASATT